MSITNSVKCTKGDNENDLLDFIIGEMMDWQNKIRQEMKEIKGISGNWIRLTMMMIAILGASVFGMARESKGKFKKKNAK